MKTLRGSWILACLVASLMVTTAAFANPLIEGYIQSINQINSSCDVEIEFMSQAGEFELFLYRSQTLDAYGNVPPTAGNLVGSVTGVDAYDTYTYWDDLSGFYITNYYYRLTDTYRTSGTWHYQLYCDYGDPGGQTYPLWPESITLSSCDCDDFVIHNPVAHQSNYSDLSRYSGAAVMSMIINWLNGSSPAPAQTSFSPPPPTSGYSAAQVENILEYHPEIASSTSWGHVADPDRAAVLFQIAYWQNANGIGAAVPTKGNYLHWVTVEGAQADACPLGGDPATYGLIGFWVDDPGDGKTFKTADEWNDSYFYAPTNGSSFEAVVEPPETSGSVVIREASTYPMTCIDKDAVAKGRSRDLVQIYAILRDLDESDADAVRRATPLKAVVKCASTTAVDAAEAGILEYGLQSDPSFASAYASTSPGTPVFVDRTDSGGNDYHLVPFIRSGVIPDEANATKASVPAGENQVKVIVRVDSATGQFLEAKYLVSGGLTMPSASSSWYWSRTYPESPFDPRQGVPCTHDCQMQTD